MSEQNSSAAAQDDIVRIEHVSNSYYENQLGIFGKRKKNQVLRDVSLTIHRDEFFGLVGESGCGKSTLANCILGMVPFEGTIEVAGMSYGKANRKEFTRHVQAVFQDPLSALDPRRRIGEILREPLDIHGIGTKEEREAKVKEMLETVGLDASYATRFPRELSGGQRQRICIGASLMLEPELVIADEAISALDVSVGAQILNLFRKIHDEKDFAMLFISHNLNVVYYLCDRIAVLYYGEIMEQGGAKEIYDNPAHPYTRILQAAIPDLKPGKEKKEMAFVEAKNARPWVEGACPFYRRCPRALDECKKAPPLTNIAKEGEPEHLVRCWRHS